MLKRTIAVVLCFLLSGCVVRKVERIPFASVTQSDKDVVVGVTTMKGEDVSFDPPGGAIKDGMISGSVKKASFEIPVDQVQRVWVQRTHVSTGRTIGLVAAVAVGTVAIVAGVVAATKQSCPFVYSWNGSEYVFDAEPYGGAITRGLEKDDYSELGMLREQDGIYRLKLTNEVDETQYTNMTELWVVDHPAGTRVVPDIQGNLHTVEAPAAPLSALDANGRDLLPWLRATDRLIWEPPSVPDAKGNLASDIVMTFPKPKDAKQVKLIANAATGLWGSYMIKKMVELHGRETGAFLKTIDDDKSARDALFKWEVQEELYALKIYVEEPTGWVVRGILPGTGPFISKDRIVPLDVSHVPGDRVKIRIHPPAGFWALNSFNMDYSTDRTITVEKVKPSSAADMNGKDVLPDLISSDDRYLAMPDIGDTANLTFRAPAHRAKMERQVILHTRGFYKLHLSATGDPDTKMLDAINNVHGAGAQFAAAQFSQWQIARKQVQVATVPMK